MWYWDVASGKITAKYDAGPGGPYNSITYSQDGELQAWGFAFGSTIVKPPATGLKVLEIPADTHFHTAFACGNRTLIVTRTGTSAFAWDVETTKRTYLECCFQPRMPWTARVAGLAWSPDRRVFASTASDNMIRFFTPSDGRLLAVLATLGFKERRALAFTPEGHYRTWRRFPEPLVYVGLTPSGEQLTLTADEFASQYGWNNDPAKVALTSSAASLEPKPSAGPGRPTDFARMPASTPAETPSPEAERRMTQIALSFADSVAVQTAEGEKRILPGQGLPAGSFRLVGLRASGERATDAAFAQLAAARNLIEIWAVPAPQLTDAAMEQIASLPTLRYLTLDGCRVTDAGVRRIARMENLDNLALRCVPITDVSLESIAKIPSLARLVLEGQGLVVTGAGLKHLQSHPKLRDLHLVSLTLNDADMEAVGQIKDLWFLNVQNNPIGDAALERLKGLARLGVLDLGGTQVTSEGMRSLQTMKGLVNVSLDGTAVGDAGLRHLETVQSLSTIRLDGTAVTDEGMKHLGAMSGLYHVSLQNTRVSDAGLLHLAKLPNLRMLHLAGTRVTDTGAKTLGQIASLTELYLSDTRVTDEGVRNLGSPPNLSKLYLVHTRVTDAVLERLIAMPKMELLDLSVTRISARGIATLKAALPKAQVLWSEPNRAAAEGVIGLGGTVSIRAKDRPEERPIKSAAELPAELFQVTRVSLAGVAQPLGQTLDGVALLSDPDFDRLESVDLSRTTFGDADLPRLTPLASLVDLSLAGTQITDQGLAQWKGPLKLRRLVLDGVPLRGPGLAGLKSLPALVDLQLACPTLTDFACKPLAELKSLRRLSLAASAVTDEGLGPLGSLQDLEELDLSGTKVTPQGVDALRKNLPKCRGSLQQPATKP